MHSQWKPGHPQRAEGAAAGGSGGLARPEPGTGVTLHVRGFAAERALLQGAVLLSQRRAPRLTVLADDQAQAADVLMIDGRDPLAMRWAATQPWLRHKPVLWVDAAGAVPADHVAVSRPLQWAILPMLLFRALDGWAKDVAAETQAASHGPVHRILVVDDSQATRSYLRSVLEPRGLRVVEADSGEAALDTLAATQVDCVLMDVLMPGIDGFEACRRIKARAGRRAPAVAMLTSKASPFNLVRGKMAGCDAYLTKPVEPDKLFEVLDGFVRLDSPPTVPARLSA